MTYTFSYSFQPNGKWFVFCVETGMTVKKDLPSFHHARNYMAVNGLLT